MWERLRRWLAAIPYSDPLERQQAVLLQLVELGKLALVVAMALIWVAVPGQDAGLVAFLALLGLIGATSLPALALVRAGRLRLGVLFATLSLTLLLSGLLYGTKLEQGSVVVFAFAVPLTLAGVVAGRRALVLVLGTGIGGFTLAVLLAELGAPGAGFARTTQATPVADAISFALIAGMLAYIIEGLSRLTREALTARRMRERELEAMSMRLEGAVRERTADLEIALGALEQRAADQARLLEENSRQRATMRALSVPVLPVGKGTIVLPLVGDLDAERLATLSDQALGAVEHYAARRLLLDITGVPLVDTAVAQGMLATLRAARLLGAEVALVGVRPEVAQAIVGLGIDLGALAVFADLQSALALAARQPGGTELVVRSHG